MQPSIGSDDNQKNEETEKYCASCREAEKQPDAP